MASRKKTNKKKTTRRKRSRPGKVARIKKTARKRLLAAKKRARRLGARIVRIPGIFGTSNTGPRGKG
jgi:hypothetical protein